MKNLSRFIKGIIITLAMIMVFYSQSFAATCNTMPVSGDWSVSETCDFPAGGGCKVPGNIDIPGNYTLSIPANTTLGLDLSVNKITFGLGKILIDSSSNIKRNDGLNSCARIVSCGGAIPSFHATQTLTTISSYKQTWDGGGFTPFYSWGKSQPFYCGFECTDGYTGSDCSTPPASSCPAGYEGNGQAITSVYSKFPNYSPDGNSIIYNANSDTKIHKKSANDTSDGTIINSKASWNPTYSPDGNWIIYENSDDGGKIYKKSANDTSDGVAINSTSSYAPVYSPDGNWIIYINWYDGWKIYKKSANDTSDGIAINNANSRDPVYSPDGNSIVYTNFNDSKLYKKSANDSSNGTAITNVASYSPKYSPDGNWIIYTNNNDGSKIYKKSANDTSNGFAINSTYSYNPAYSPDGNWIVYMNLIDGNKFYKKCSLSPVVSGTCGGANGTSVAVAPTTGLCTTGAATYVSGTGPWTWTCAGTDGGTDQSCSANKSSTASRYPGCNTDDITIGSQVWSACNLGTNISGLTSSSYGTYQEVWNGSTMILNSCSSGYHIPSQSQFDAACTAISGTNCASTNSTTLKNALQLPLAGTITYNGNPSTGYSSAGQTTLGKYAVSESLGSSVIAEGFGSPYLTINSSLSFVVKGWEYWIGSIRCLKN